MMSTLLYAAFGGSIGAILRAFLAAHFDNSKGGFPFGTFAANMISSFLLGAIISLAAKGYFDENEQFFLETGFCATLSTFSSMAWQITSMIVKRHPLLAFIYALSTFCGGMALFLISNHSF